MKKAVKQIVAFFVIMVMLANHAIHVNAAEIVYNIEMRKAVDSFIRAGWTEEEIEYFLTDEIVFTHKDVKDTVSSDKKYFRIADDGVYELTKEECELQLEQIAEMETMGGDLVQPMTIVPEGEEVRTTISTTDGYMEYYVEAYNCGNGKFIIGARYEWLKSPINRKKDVFALGHDDNVMRDDGFAIYSVYKADYGIVSGSNYYTDTHVSETPSLIREDDGGVAVVYDLMNDDGTGAVSAYNHRGYIQYKVDLDKDEDSFAIFAEYLHQETLLEISSISISFPAGGSVSVSPENKFKRMSPNPYMSVFLE